MRICVVFVKRIKLKSIITPKYLLNMIKSFLFSLLQDDYNSISQMVDKYLGHLYPDYWNHVRSVLVRQSRDLLLFTYNGNLSRFGKEFLAPAAEIIAKIKSDCEVGQVSFLPLPTILKYFCGGTTRSFRPGILI